MTGFPPFTPSRLGGSSIASPRRGEESWAGDGSQHLPTNLAQLADNMSTTSSAPQKLTKKQQKALRHKSGVRKGKGKEVSGGEEAQLDVPEEDLLLDDGDDDDGDASPSKKDKKSKKRKREDNVADAANANDDEQGSERSAAKAAATSKKNKKKPASAAPPKERKQRFIVFVGESSRAGPPRPR